MLTNDLVVARIVKSEIRPRYIDPGDEELRELAEALLEIFRRHQGLTLGELEDELAELLGAGTSFQLHRGLAKLLLDRTTLETRAPIEPEAVRAAVFEASALAWRGDDATQDDTNPKEISLEGVGHGETSSEGGDDGEASLLAVPPRDEVLGAVARQLGLEPSQIERALYADLKSEQVLESFDDLEPQELLHRYNLALAQAVLLRARELTIDLAQPGPRVLRALLSKLKFHQLLYRVRRRGDGWRLVVDGPLSLFRAHSRYGLQMASFLPTLVSLEGWSLKAKVLWGRARRAKTFHLSPDVGLTSSRRLRGAWRPEELSHLPQRFADLSTPWVLDLEGEPVDLGNQGVLIPDYVFRHPDGAVVHMEVFGYWNRGAVTKRLELLRRRGPKNLILAVSKALAGDGEGFEDLPSEVYVYRTAPIARQVVKRLEALREGGA